MIKIFVNGTFDILHTGHLELLAYARSLGDFLYVGIDSDRRVKELKGPARPINNQQERKTMLEAVRYVDSVHIFDSDNDLRALIADCDVMVKGDDYQGQPVVGQEVCKQIIFFKKIDGYSTTQKISDITSRR
jgi:D-beta-D-heptose 7-phosphate kinase/D-beta-D-heptose 1-phosphate adenosyltransferase